MPRRQQAPARQAVAFADIPFRGSSRARLIDAGLQLFRSQAYESVELSAIVEIAGVTVGALYHHFQSKLGFYGALRDEMTQRLLDRMEAASDASAPELRLETTALAAFDGLTRINAGRLLIDADPRGNPDAIAAFLGEIAAQTRITAPDVLGMILVAAIRAAAQLSGDNPKMQGHARAALVHLLSSSAHT